MGELAGGGSVGMASGGAMAVAMAVAMAMDVRCCGLPSAELFYLYIMFSDCFLCYATP